MNDVAGARAHREEAHREELPIEVEVIYDGPDVASVAESCELSPEALVQAHSTTTYQVAFPGFAAGFFYLSALSDAFASVERKQLPRPVRAGDLAIIAGYAAIYPSNDRGGWSVIGRVLHPKKVQEVTNSFATYPAVRFVQS